MIEQHRAIARGRVEIAREEGDRASRLTQNAAKRQGVPDSEPFLDIILDDPHRPIGKPLQPKDAGLEIMCRHVVIEP
jgi:hypothetical protein